MYNGHFVEGYDAGAVEIAAAAPGARVAGGRVAEGGWSAGTGSDRAVVGAATVAVGAAMGPSPLKELPQRHPPALAMPMPSVGTAAAEVRRVMGFDGDGEHGAVEDDHDREGGRCIEERGGTHTARVAMTGKKAHEGGRGGGAVATIAAAAEEEETPREGEGRACTRLMMSVEEALARTSQWLAGVKGELTSAPLSDSPDARPASPTATMTRNTPFMRRTSFTPGEGTGDPDTIERARLVDEAFAKTQTWLVSSSYEYDHGLEVPRGDPRFANTLDSLATSQVSGAPIGGDYS